jgi:hypothetical protein
VIRSPHRTFKPKEKPIDKLRDLLISADELIERPVHALMLFLQRQLHCSLYPILAAELITAVVLFLGAVFVDLMPRSSSLPWRVTLAICTLTILATNVPCIDMLLRVAKIIDREQHGWGRLLLSLRQQSEKDLRGRQVKTLLAFLRLMFIACVNITLALSLPTWISFMVFLFFLYSINTDILGPGGGERGKEPADAVSAKS